MVGDAESPSMLEVAFRLADLAFLPLATIGAIAAVSGSDLGAVLLLVSIAERLASHLVVGLLAYHRVMARPWPEVPPLRDDDD